MIHHPDKPLQSTTTSQVIWTMRMLTSRSVLSGGELIQAPAPVASSAHPAISRLSHQPAVRSVQRASVVRTPRADIRVRPQTTVRFFLGAAVSIIAVANPIKPTEICGFNTDIVQQEITLPGLVPFDSEAAVFTSVDGSDCLTPNSACSICSDSSQTNEALEEKERSEA